MTEIKWIKIAISIFDDEKIQLIEELPEGDAILLIWFKLLILAGKKNACGLIYLTEKIPYSEEMLTKLFRKKINLVRLSLKTFENFEMIEIKNNIIKVLNWEKYQNEEALEKLKKLSRERQRRYREKQNLLENNVIVTKSNDKSNVTNNVTAHNSNALDLELDLEKEEDLKKENLKRKKNNKNIIQEKIKIKFGDSVSMTQDEYHKLLNSYGENDTKKMIEILDNYKGANGKTYKSDYKAILCWVVKRYNEDQQKEKNENVKIYKTKKQIIDEQKDKYWNDYYKDDENQNLF